MRDHTVKKNTEYQKSLVPVYVPQKGEVTDVKSVGNVAVCLSQSKILLIYRFEIDELRPMV